jgi:hypothetical protein
MINYKKSVFILTNSDDVSEETAYRLPSFNNHRELRAWYDALLDGVSHYPDNLSEKNLVDTLKKGSHLFDDDRMFIALALSYAVCITSRVVSGFDIIVDNRPDIYASISLVFRTEYCIPVITYSLNGDQLSNTVDQEELVISMVQSLVHEITRQVTKEFYRHLNVPS